MLTYLDTCIFIDWIEGPAPFDMPDDVPGGYRPQNSSSLRIDQ